MPDSSPENDIEAEAREVEAEVKDDKSSAESSPAEKKPEAKADGEGEKGDMLSAVKAALEPKEKSPPSEKQPDSKPDESKAEAKKEGKVEDDDGGLTEEELSHLKAKTRKRIEKLSADKAALSAEIEAIRPKAEQFDRIVQFTREAGLTPQEVNQTFDIARKLKLDPKAAYEQIKPVYEQLQRMFGDVLPDDLQTRVNQGLITEADAKVMARSRTEAAINAQTVERLRRQDEERRASEAVQAQVNDVKAKVTEWESSKEKADPDWKLKQPHVMRAVEIELLRRGPDKIPTAAEAIQIAENALKKVNDELKGFAPRKQEIKPVTEVASSRSTPKPRNMLEAARAGLAAMNG